MIWPPYYNVLVLQAHAHKHLRPMQTKAGLKKCTPGIRYCTLLQLCLALTYHGDRQLDCSWPLTCALCSARSDFIVGNMRWVQERVHGWGKKALHTVRLHISVSPWAFSLDTAFSPYVVWSTLPGDSTSLPRIGAFQLGTVPGWSPTPLPFPSSTTGGRKGKKNAARAFDRQNTMWALMLGGTDVILTCHWPLQLSKLSILQSYDPPNSQEKMPRRPVP